MWTDEIALSNFLGYVFFIPRDEEYAWRAVDGGVTEGAFEAALRTLQTVVLSHFNFWTALIWQNA